MGTIEDLTNLARKGPAIVNSMDPLKINTKSVIKGANEATWQFPCLISDTCPIDMGNAVVRHLDRLYAAFSQTWISMHPFMDISLDPTPLSYLKRMHQNVKFESAEIENYGEMTTEEFFESVLETGGCAYINKDQSLGIVFTESENLPYGIMKKYKEGLKPFLEEFDLKPFQEAEYGETNALNLADAYVQGKVQQAEDKRRDIDLRNMNNSKPPQLLDRDVKKANDMLPFGIQVRLVAKNEKNEMVSYVDFVLGVKCIMHPIKSDDMVKNIAAAVQNKSVFFKFLRWTTGEISLVKDIILNMNDIKNDALNKQNGKNPFFGTMKRLKEKKFGLRNLTVPHAMIPNISLVVSSFDVDYLRDHYGVDVMDVSTVRKVLSALYGVCFVIVDEGVGTISMFLDGAGAYQTYSIETLEREMSLNSNKLGKEIGRMISH